MMRIPIPTTLYYFIFVFFLALASSCSSGKKELQRGNYASSVAKAVDRLRSSPNNNKARTTLSKGYALALNHYLEEVARFKASNQALKWENVLSSFNLLNNMYDDIRRCPACLEIVPNPRSFLAEASDARKRAAQVRYDLGIAELNKGDRQSAKLAYESFLRAKDLVRNYPNIDQAILDAKDAATIKVVLEKVPVYSQRYRISDEYFSNKMFEFLQQNRRMSDFVEFFTPTEAIAQQLTNPNHVIRMQFDDFNVGQVYVRETTDNIVKDSVIVGTVDVEGESRNVYGTVKAKMTTFEKTVTSNAVLDVKIYDSQTNRLLMQDKIPGEFVWQAFWGNFQGDERALSEDQKSTCNLREVQPPAAEDLFIEVTRPIYNQVTSRLRNFYRNY